MLAYLIFSAIILAIIFIISLFIDHQIFLILLYNFIYVWAITLGSGITLVLTFDKKHFSFMGALTGGTFLKIMLSLGFLFILVRSFDEKVLEIVLSFFFFYLVFTVFEVYQLLYNLRPILKRANNSETK